MHAFIDAHRVVYGVEPIRPPANSGRFTLREAEAAP